VTAWTGTTTITDDLTDQELGDTVDLTQVELANLLVTPSQTPPIFKKTVNNGASFTNMTAIVSDDLPSTQADMGLMPTFSSGGYLVVGADQQFRQILLVMDHVNTNTSILNVDYWDGDVWRGVLGLHDGTSFTALTFGVSLASLGQTGTISFESPLNWQKTTIDGVSAYYVRLYFSAPLSVNVHIAEVRLGANAFDPSNCEIHAGRVWCNDALHPGRVWYSERFSLETFLADNFIVASSGGDPVVRPFGLDDQLFVFTKNTVNRVVGSTSDNFDVIPTGSEEGLFGNAVCRGRGRIFYRGAHGIYALPPSGFAINISIAIYGLFHGFGSEDGRLQPIDGNQAGTETLEFSRAKLWYGYTDTSGARHELTFDLETERWEPTDRKSTSYLRLDDIGEFYSAQDGFVYLRNTGNTDPGAGSLLVNVPLRFRTQYLDFGTPTQDKQITEIVIDADTSGATMRFFADFDNGRKLAQDVSLSNSGRGLLHFPLNDDTQCRNVALRLEADNGGVTVRFYKVTLYFIPLSASLTQYVTD